MGGLLKEGGRRPMQAGGLLKAKGGMPSALWKAREGVRCAGRRLAAHLALWDGAGCARAYFFQWSSCGTTASMWARTCSAGQLSLAMWVTQKSMSCSLLVYLKVPPE